mgnify:CR=1 FL=1
MKKIKSFTLAEVLITLVIIGIIAAITVPNLIVSYQKKQTAIKLKKTYSEICQAVALAEVQFGNKETWEWGVGLSGTDFFNKYLVPFVTISKKKMSEVRQEGISYHKVNGQVTTQVTSLYNDAYVTTLSSGVQILTSKTVSYNEEIWKKQSRYGLTVDLNGPQKPNRYGRDVFLFYVTPDGVFPGHNDDDEPYTQQRPRSELLDGPSKYGYQCNEEGLGLWCAAVIMADNWEIKDDYPW